MKKHIQMNVLFFVDPAGVEPASKQGTEKVSTCLSTSLFFIVHPAGSSLVYAYLVFFNR